MKIDDVRIREVRNPAGKLKAVVSVTIDECFVVHDIKIFEREDGYAIAMPSRKTTDGKYKDIAHPLNSETREMLQSIILSEYQRFQLEDTEPSEPIRASPSMVSRMS